MLAEAREQAPGATFKKEDLRRLGFPPNSFKGIVASFSLIHLSKDDVKEVLDTFHDLMKQDGVLYLALHGGSSREQREQAPLNEGREILLNVYTEQEIRQRLSECDFTVQRFYHRGPEEEELQYEKFYIIARSLQSR